MKILLFWVAYLVNCDFEHGITSGKCNLKQLHDDQFDWTLKTGATGVSGSGPLADYTTAAGTYVFQFIETKPQNIMCLTT